MDATQTPNNPETNGHASAPTFESEPTPGPTSIHLSRRALFGGGAAVAGVAALAGALGMRAEAERVDANQAASAAHADIVPFHGAHQAGIDTPAQRHATFVALDLVLVDADTLRTFLRDLTATIEQITTGSTPPQKPGRDATLPAETNFATGLSPARLTVTVGLGPSVFGLQGVADHPRPKQLYPLPPFAGDALDPRWSDGDVLLQICADDLQVVSAAHRSLRARIPGFATIRWTQHGFLSTPADGGTPRNMFGQKDGTANPAHSSATFDDVVWAGADEPAWFAGGSYLTFRKIRMKTGNWDLTPVAEQDAVIGRARSTGAPLTGSRETDTPNLDAVDAAGTPVIASDAHIRRVHGKSMFRRSFTYDYGDLISAAGGSPDPVAQPSAADHSHAPGTPPHTHGGHDSIDNGLLFCAYGNDPDAQFIAAQRAMAQSDRLNAFIQHTGSAIFAILPGCAPGSYLGASLLN